MIMANNHALKYKELTPLTYQDTGPEFTTLSQSQEGLRLVDRGRVVGVVASGSSALESTGTTGTLILIILVIYCGMFKLLHGEI